MQPTMEGGGGCPKSKRWARSAKPTGLCFSFLPLCPLCRVSLLSRARGRFEGPSLMIQASRLLSVPLQHRTPHPHGSSPTCRFSRFFLSEAEGPRGFWTLGSPRGFLQPWLPRPRSGSPAPPRLGSAPPGRALLARSQSLQLSPGCPCSYLVSQPPPYALFP